MSNTVCCLHRAQSTKGWKESWMNEPPNNLTKGAI